MSHIERRTTHAKARHVLAIVLSLMVGVLSLGIAAPAQAAAPDSNTDAYVCLWHRVRSGDTLNELAARYGTTALAIRRANGLKSTRIYTGTRLCIPRNRPQPPAPPAPPAGGPWYGEYWNNTNQSGPAALVRNDAAINFDWGFGSPDLSRIQPDYFSARWTRNIRFTEGVWRFGVLVDDGVRITVDNQVVMDFFNNVGPQQRTVDIPLSAGEHRVTVDYVEQTGVAYIKFNTQRIGPCPVYGGVGCPPPPCLPGQNCPNPPFPPDNAKFNNGPWQTDYFANPFFTPPPFTSRVEPGMRFDWRGAPPIPGMPGTFWTARFTQVRYFPQGVYQFVARVDDGIRIFVDGTLIMDQFREQSTRTFTSEVNFGAGNHTIVVEYVQYGGSSDLSLYWDFLGDPNAPAVRQMVANPAAIPYFPGK
jgi:hypothetical protein